MAEESDSQQAPNTPENSLELTPPKSCSGPLLQNVEPNKETEETELLPQGWPTSPKTVKASGASIVADVAVDLVLLAAAVAFFVFGLTVRSYNQTPIALHPRKTDALIEATKYVRN
jgi:hypothetical protein